MVEILLLIWALSAAQFDLRQRRLPNALTLGGFGIGFAILVATGGSLLGADSLQAWQGVGLALLLTLPAYAMGLLGAGDVKLCGAIAILTGLYHFVVIYSLAAFLALGMVLASRYIQFLPYGDLLCPAGRTGESRTRHGRKIPFGAALGAGLAVVMIARLIGFPG